MYEWQIDAMEALKTESNKRNKTVFELEKLVSELGYKTDFDYWEMGEELIPPENKVYCEIYPESILDRSNLAIIRDYWLMDNGVLSVSFDVQTPAAIEYYKESEKRYKSFLIELFSDSEMPTNIKKYVEG